MKNKWIAIRDLEYGEISGEAHRYNLGSMLLIWEGNLNVGTGIFRKAIYLMPRAKTVIVETYSVWEDPRTHGCEGTSYHIADQDEIALLANDTGDDRLMALVPEAIS